MQSQLVILMIASFPCIGVPWAAGVWPHAAREGVGTDNCGPSPAITINMKYNGIHALLHALWLHFRMFCALAHSLTSTSAHAQLLSNSLPQHRSTRAVMV